MSEVKTTAADSSREIEREPSKWLVVRYLMTGMAKYGTGIALTIMFWVLFGDDLVEVEHTFSRFLLIVFLVVASTALSASPFLAPWIKEELWPYILKESGYRK